ncbi:type II 3-dehydroquinate dehydratase [Defluviicoccus vanus]|uniref:3-dehydroquinate dehydratase n=1 Tax=Defluviicoccus vanus TaxID=111831 RepID=A0A7H1N5S4_9PROT|nr:type II 3-dehydroquinate dehydratase [Defluviicoccus vanus]QNT71060.1 type II 3-dehydroquinate dehydratase [Defluviicoccus vanus]
MRIFILNGPNLNLLGEREPAVYGHTTLADIEHACRQRAEALGASTDFRQSNAEGDLIDWIHQARRDADALIINAGAYTHTSIAIMDALLALTIPVIEVHLSNIFRRESFRHHSYISQAATGMICGLGAKGYELAIEAAVSAHGTGHSSRGR